MAIGIAILGAGFFASQEYLPAIKKCSKFTLKAVYSRSQQSADKLASAADPDVDAYYDSPNVQGRSLDLLLAREDIEAVIIALPITEQPRFIRKAFEAGKHVLSEKPIAASTSIAQSLISQHNALTSGKIWVVAENFRFLEAFDFAFQALKDIGGETISFGVQLFAMIDENDQFYQTKWRQTPDYQGGFLLDGGVHFVGGLRYLLGATGAYITRLSAFTTLLRDQLAPVDTVNSSMLLNNGRSGTFRLSYGSKFKGCFEVEVSSTLGSVCLSPVEVKVQRLSSSGEIDTSTTSFEFDGGVGREIEIFAKSIEKGKADDRMTPSQALADLRILEALLRSGEQKGQILDVE